MTKIKTFSTEETTKEGFRLGNELKLGNVVCLDGDLGAGKTAFVKGIAQALGIDKYITSPTFTIVNQYEGKILLYHFDVYRIANAEDMLEMGFEEYLSPEAIVVIEWASLIQKILPSTRIEVLIELSNEPNERTITIEHVNAITAG